MENLNFSISIIIHDEKYQFWCCIHGAVSFNQLVRPSKRLFKNPPVQSWPLIEQQFLERFQTTPHNQLHEQHQNKPTRNHLLRHNFYSFWLIMHTLFVILFCAALFNDLIIEVVEGKT